MSAQLAQQRLQQHCVPAATALPQGRTLHRWPPTQLAADPARRAQHAPSTRRPAAATAAPVDHLSELRAIDDRLSMRPLTLDPAGYYIIRLEREAREIVADHYSNAINERGLAVDEQTGEVIGCRPGQAVRLPRRTFRGRTAKEISVRVLEADAHFDQHHSKHQHQQEQEQHAREQSGRKQGPPAAQVQPALPWMSRLEHANYLGREFARAEAALLSGAEYVQD